MIEFILGLPTWFTVVMILFGAAFVVTFGTMAVLGFRYWLSWKTTLDHCQQIVNYLNINFDDTGEML